MSETNIETLVTTFSADIRRYEAALRRQVRQTDNQAKAIERRWAQMNRRIERNQEQTEQRLRRIVSGAALILAGRQLVAYEREWRNVTNTLRQYEDVLGPATQSTLQLNRVANDAGVDIAQLGPLIGSASRAARNLGDRGGQDVLDFGEAFSKAAALANTGQAAVAGASTQLSQAIASPVVQLQEFNSVVEGTPRLAQAFAEGIEDAGGSVARLRQLIASGEVSGEELFGALLTQLPRIREEFESLNQGPEQALTRLRNRLREFVGTNRQVIASTQGLARVIDFFSSNLDAFADVVVVAGGALVGFFGARASARIVAGLGAQAAGFRALHSQIATVAFFSGRAAGGMTALRAATAFIGGPVVAGVTVFAGAMALLGLNASEASASFDTFDSVLNRYKQTLRDATADQERVEGLRELLSSNEDITEAIRAQGIASREVLVQEIAALDQRIAKNRELQRVYETSLRAQATGLEASVDRQRQEISVVRELRREAERTFQSQFGRIPGTQGSRGLTNPLGPDGAALSRQALAPTDETIAAAIAGRFEEIEDKKRRGELLTRRERRDLEAIIQLREDEASLLSTRATIEELNRGEIDTTPPGQPTGGTGGVTAPDEEEVRKTKAFLAEIDRAYNSTFDTRVEAINRLRNERLSALEDTVLDETEKANERVRINALAEEQITRLREEQASEEIDLFNQVIDERDRAADRVLEIAEREFEGKRRFIQQNLNDEALRSEALIALEETRMQTISELEEALHQERLDRAFEEARTIEEGFRATFAIMVEEAERANAEVGSLFARTFGPGGRVSQALAQSTADAIVFGDSFTESIQGAARAIIADLIGALVQLGIEFVVQKTLGAAAVATTTGQAAAAASAWAPAAALASLATLGANAAPAAASLVTAVALSKGLAAAGSLGFREGGRVGGRGTGTSDSNLVRVSKGEFITNAEATRKNLALLEAINRGEDPGDMAPRFQAGGMVGRSLASGDIARPRVNVQAAQPPNVTVQPAENNTNVINVNNVGEAIAAYLSSPQGTKNVINIFGKNAGALRGALGGSGGI